MARISGIDIPKEKRGVIALTYIYGIGKSRAQKILKKADVNENKKVNGITYDAKDTMVIKSFEEIYNETEQKLGIKNKAVFIEHVKGHLKLSEKSILIGVACKHRDEAYRLSRFIIEEIKKRSPIWKKEHYENEDSQWLKGISLTT